MPNRLANAQSPYLLQHKDNPVDWHEWGPEAFEKAAAEDKPVFLSIGYSTCHWCHVMAHESFEDAEVARLMNDAFVSIKVDREERPDIDQIYMTVCQMMTGQGGWPLTVLLTPQKEPFFAATYLPKESRQGRIGMLDLAPRVASAWEEEREKVTQTAATLTQRLQQADGHTPAGNEPTVDDIEAAAAQLGQAYDATHGGFGGAPKFPSPHHLNLLLRYAHRTDDEEAVAQVTHTLRAMRQGGVFDQVGYGFHRYSTDVEWKLPHFEKMLYDQATLLLALTEAYQVTGEGWMARTIDEVITYLTRDMRAPEGAFYSAENADSEGREGAFYVWTADQLRTLLPEEVVPFVFDLFNITEEGNFLEEATRQRTGENVLHQTESLAAVAERHDMSLDAAEALWEAARTTLLTARRERERPSLDDKILTDWNGLLMAALAQAGAALDEPRYVTLAEDAARFIRETLTTDDGRLLHRYRAGEAGIPGQLDDYAFYIFGLLHLYEATFNPSYLAEAQTLVDVVEAHFDSDAGGYYLNADDAEELITRPKEAYDGAIPSGNSVMLRNLVHLARLTGEMDLETAARRIGRFFADHIEKQPTGFTAMLCGVDLLAGPTTEVVLVGEPEAADLQALVRPLRTTYTPRTVVLNAPPTGAMDALAPFTAAHSQTDGQATAYVCQNFSCEQPTTDRDTMMAQVTG
jgi:uncharacterized protein